MLSGRIDKFMEAVNSIRAEVEIVALITVHQNTSTDPTHVTKEMQVERYLQPKTIWMTRYIQV